MKKKGFAISFDALLATVLTITVLTFVGFGMPSNEEAITPSEIRIRQTVDDIFTTLDNSGFLAKALVDETGKNPASEILKKAETLIPKNTGLYIKITEYSPVEDLTECKSEKTFEKCFEELGNQLEAGKSIPENKEIMHGRKLSIAKMAGINISGNECQIIEINAKEKEKPKVMFQEEEKFVSTQAIVSSTEIMPEANFLTGLECCSDPQNPQVGEKAVVTLKIKDNSRDPIAVVMAMDRSGSMEIDDIVKQETSGTFNGGTCGGVGCYATVTTSNCPANDAEYTNWTLIESFTADDAFLNFFPELTEERYDHFFSGTGNDSTTCGIIPKMKIVAPDGTTYYRSSYTLDPSFYTYLYRNTIELHNTGDKVWDIYAWSNIPFNTNLYRRFWGYIYADNKLDTLSGGQQLIVTDGGECQPDMNPQSAKKVGDLVLPALGAAYYYLNIYADIYFINYDDSVSGCRPRFFLKEANSGWQSSTYTCYNNYCSVYRSYPQAGEKYEMWAWSDDEIDLTTVRFGLYTADSSTGYLVKNFTADSSSNGCNNEDCWKTTIPGNCNNKTNWIDGVYGGGNDLDVFKVNASDNLTGLKIDASTSGYSGVCGTPSLMIRTDPVWNTTTTANPWVRYFGTPSAGDWEFEGWSDELVDYTIQWIIGRMDAAKKAAKTFIDNVDWDSSDKFGLVSFSSLAQVASPMANNNINAVKIAIDSLVPGGQTGLAGAITQSTSMLENANLTNETNRFIILLTDGRANICLDGTFCSEQNAGNDAIAAANLARQNADATIYVIGFADPSIGSYSDTLRQIAKDANTAYCNDGEKCGRYYFAQNEEEFKEIYGMVVGEIRESFGTANIKIPIKEGITPIDIVTTGKSGVWDDLEGTWDTETANNPEFDLVWDAIGRTISVGGKSIYYIKENIWFAMQFEVVVPCNGTYCDLNYVVFPDERMEIIDNSKNVTRWTKATGDNKYCNSTNQPCADAHIKMPFKYKDIGINFSRGIIVGGDILLDLNIGNVGYKEIDLTATSLKIKFLNEDHSPITNVDCDTGGCSLRASNENIANSPLNGSVTVPAVGDGNIIISGITLCDIEGCAYNATTDTETTIENIKIPTISPGTIIAEIEHKSVSECSKGNLARIYCGAAKFKFFTIDYYTWVK